MRFQQMSLKSIARACYAICYESFFFSQKSIFKTEIIAWIEFGYPEAILFYSYDISKQISGRIFFSSSSSFDKISYFVTIRLMCLNFTSLLRKHQNLANFKIYPSFLSYELIEHLSQMSSKYILFHMPQLLVAMKMKNTNISHR